MNEAAFWSDRLRPGLVRQCQALKLRHHFNRVENLVGDGAPDVDYCIDGVAGKIELKYAAAHPVRDTSQVLGKDKGLRRSQIVYASRRAWAGGLIWCVVGSPEMTWVIDLRKMSAPEMAEIGGASTSRLCEISAWWGGRGIDGTLPLLLLAEFARGRFGPDDGPTVF